ncbi:MAG: YicC family protein [Betaproteobacteria bacterium]|nr:YicC family protein [Betaproteobacteria bacterium]
MIHSMTGYAVAQAAIGASTLGIELRSVNSRYLEIQFRLSEELRVLEPALRGLFAGKLRRGKLDCRLYFSPDPAATRDEQMNAPALARLRRLEQALRAEFPEAPALHAADILRWPGVLSEESVADDVLRAKALELARQVLGELVATRAREGEKLANIVRERAADMAARVEVVAPLVPAAIATFQAKLAERLREAIGSGDDDRIRQEVAMFGMKIDVDEELGRLRTHLAEIARVLERGGECGKRLDFLMQELGREANTLGAKAGSQPISDCALELKLLIEQMREQVQNIE